jgi:hypothetical protein
MRQATLTLCALALGATVMSGCSEIDNVAEYRDLAGDVNAAAGHKVWFILPEAAEVTRVTVEGDGRTVELRQSADELWVPGPGVSVATSILMEESEDHFLPLPAYRRLEVDAGDPQFGLTSSTLGLVVERRTGPPIRMTFGGANPTGGGFYASRAGDKYVYVVVNEVIDDLRSLLAGTRVAPAPDPELEQVLEADAADEDPEEVTNPWLGQVLSASGS